jgi:uncharacterized protein (DUF1501 family)
MLTVETARGAHDRRNFLRVGALGAGGLALPGVLRQRAAAAESGRAKDTSVILVFLSGGPSQHDTFDPKPDAPEEFRGPFASIPTALPGVRVTELFPALARRLDRFTVLRSVHHNDGSHHHSYHWMLTGTYPQNLQFYVNQRPAVGAVAAKYRGPARAGVPPYVTIPKASGYGGAAYLGVGCNTFEVPDPNAPAFQVPNLKPAGGLTADALADRQLLLRSFDRMRRDHDATGTAAAMDSFQRAASELVLGRAARDAFDLNREAVRLRDRYGRTRLGQSCLLARRLVEAGVTLVMIEDYEFMEWDLHATTGTDQTVAKGTRVKGPHLDRALSALVDDLDDRGMLDRTLVLAMGEFGRTPKVNPNGGRDHWGNVFSVLLAGGGLRHGQVVGSSTARGENPKDRPLGPQNILATAYHVLGIDPTTAPLDTTGRPIPLLAEPEPIKELV